MIADMSLGTKASCNCQSAPAASLSSNNLTATIYYSACNSTQTQAQCTGIAANPAKAMTQFPNDATAGNGKILCVERGAETTTYVALAENLNTDGTCKTGFIACGGEDGADEHSYKMCVPGTDCPITRMVVANTYTNSTAGVTYNTVSTLTTGTNDQLFFTKNGNNSPLSEILASAGHVCKFNNDVSYWGGAAESKYLNAGSANPTIGKVAYTCDGGADSRFEELVSVNPFGIALTFLVGI